MLSGLARLGILQRSALNNKPYGDSFCKIVRTFDAYQKAESVMLYVSIKSEAPTTELFKALNEDGKKIYVPITSGVMLNACEVNSKTEYERATFGTYEPKIKKLADKKNIDISIVPGTLFSEKGGRCGYGMGCYDRFLQDYKGIKIGLAYSCQVIRSFPLKKNDVKMDYIITEEGLIDCEKGYIDNCGVDCGRLDR